MEKHRIAAFDVPQPYIAEHIGVEHTMTAKIEVKCKLKVNGKEYASREEMPENIGSAYDRALANASGSDSANPGAPATRIVFLGQEYSNLDSMPDDVRQTYEEVLSTAQGRGEGGLRSSKRGDKIGRNDLNTPWSYRLGEVRRGSRTRLLSVLF